MLKVFSDFLDKRGQGLPGQPPYDILDSGCGVGVLGVCAAGALSALPVSFRLRAQDRDDLSRVFTAHNARRNGFDGECFQAYTEPLLAGPPDCRWDIILTNIPAKAGRPVLEDFVRRSAAILKKDGLVFLVAVNTLADFFRSRIAQAGAPLVREESGKEHTVFVYGRSEAAVERKDSPIIFDENFPQAYPFYIRNRNTYEMEGLSYRLDTVHGAPDFDSPSAAIQAAAKLTVKLGLSAKLCGKDAAVLVHDSGQGHFALWLAQYLCGGDFRWVFSGANAVALAAARSALNAALPGARASIIPAADISLDRQRIEAAGRFALIAFFPEKSPETAWQGLSGLAAPGGIIIAGMSSVQAERFDRKKPPLLHRLGDLKRKGFRALAYQVQ